MFHNISHFQGCTIGHTLLNIFSIIILFIVLLDLKQLYILQSSKVNYTKTLFDMF